MTLIWLDIEDVDGTKLTYKYDEFGESNLFLLKR